MQNSQCKKDESRSGRRFISGGNADPALNQEILILTYEGLWQRVSFVFMYIPYIALTGIR